MELRGWRWSGLERYTMVKKLQEAQRNQGHVCLMQDVHDHSMVAVKCMPNNWVQTSDEAFMEAHPEDSPFASLSKFSSETKDTYTSSVAAGTCHWVVVNSEGMLAVYRDSTLTRVVGMPVLSIEAAYVALAPQSHTVEISLIGQARLEQPT
eukprot:2619881-Amphidinium_carterae.1